MKRHTRVWLKSRGYYAPNMLPNDLNIPCEFCRVRSIVDINHIEPRGMGGSKTKDTPENLIGLCRYCHNEFEAKRISKADMFTKVEEILHYQQIILENQ